MNHSHQNRPYRLLQALFLVFLAFAITTGLFPLARLWALVTFASSMEVADLVTIVFQLAAFALTVLGFRRYRALTRQIDRERLSCTKAIRVLEDDGGAATTAQLDALVAAGGTTAELLERMRRSGVTTDPDRQRALAQPGQDDLLSRADSLDGLQRPCLRFGVLGTFIGLALAMMELGTADQRFGTTALFAAMQTCFTTSIAGLVGSVLIGTLHDHANRDIERIGLDWRRLLDQGATSDPARGFVPDDLNGMKRALHATCRSVIGLAVSIDTQNRVISDGVAALQHKQLEVDAFLRGVGEIREAVLKDMHSIREAVQPEAWGAEITQAFDKTLHNLVGNLETHVRGSMACFDRAAATLQSSCNAMSAAGAALVDRATTTSDAQRRAAVAVPRLARQTIAPVRALLEDFQRTVTKNAAQRQTLDVSEITLAIDEAKTEICRSLKANAPSPANPATEEVA